jgi:hypothetical protein
MATRKNLRRQKNFRLKGKSTRGGTKLTKGTTRGEPKRTTQGESRKSIIDIPKFDLENKLRVDPNYIYKILATILLNTNQMSNYEYNSFLKIFNTNFDTDEINEEIELFKGKIVTVDLVDILDNIYDNNYEVFIIILKKIEKINKELLNDVPRTRQGHINENIDWIKKILRRTNRNNLSSERIRFQNKLIKFKIQNQNQNNYLNELMKEINEANEL